MKIFWTKKATQDLEYFKKNNKKLYSRIKKLIEDIKNDPFHGIGKPEPLKHEFQGCWSRRISGDNRLIYKIKKDRIDVLQCRYHYQ